MYFSISNMLNLKCTHEVSWYKKCLMQCLRRKKATYLLILNFDFDVTVSLRKSRMFLALCGHVLLVAQSSTTVKQKGETIWRPKPAHIATLHQRTCRPVSTYFSGTAHIGRMRTEVNGPNISNFFMIYVQHRTVAGIPSMGSSSDDATIQFRINVFH